MDTEFYENFGQDLNDNGIENIESKKIKNFFEKFNSGLNSDQIDFLNNYKEYLKKLLIKLIIGVNNNYENVKFMLSSKYTDKMTETAIGILSLITEDSELITLLSVIIFKCTLNQMICLDIGENVEFSVKLKDLLLIIQAKYPYCVKNLDKNLKDGYGKLAEYKKIDSFQDEKFIRDLFLLFLYEINTISCPHPYFNNVFNIIKHYLENIQNVSGDFIEKQFDSASYGGNIYCLTIYEICALTAYNIKLFSKNSCIEKNLLNGKLSKYWLYRVDRNTNKFITNYGKNKTFCVRYTLKAVLIMILELIRKYGLEIMEDSEGLNVVLKNLKSYWKKNDEVSVDDVVKKIEEFFV